MKTLNTKLILFLAVVTLTGVGCGKSSQFETPATYQPPLINNDGTIPVSPDGPTGTPDTSYSNNDKTVNFKPVSIPEFNSYVAMHPLNSPKDFKLTVDLESAGNGRFGGVVKISYTDTGVQYTGVFESGLGTNVSMSTLKDNNVKESEYNRWFIINGKYYFSAFFQDNYGAIVLVVDNYASQGDAQGGGMMSGSVYYKNFAQSYANQSPYRKCWFIRAGPFTCRSESVINKSQAIPTDGYTKLGTFTALNKAAAFNE